MNKIKIIALFGESGAGKDTIQSKISFYYSDIHSIISCTTRPKRDYETDGIDYHFLTVEEFTKNLLNGDMIEATEFRGWFYGTPIWALDKDKINVGVFNIAGIEAILQDDRLEVIPVYIHALDKTRLLRSLNREENPDCMEICRRFQTDAKDFSDIDDIDAFAFFNEHPDPDGENLRAFMDNIISNFLNK